MNGTTVNAAKYSKHLRHINGRLAVVPLNKAQRPRLIVFV